MRILFFAILLLMSSFTADREPPCPPIPLLKQAPFPVGTALNVEKLKYEEKYWTTALRHFNSFTPEKILKPRFIQPRQGQFDFAETDHLVEFCRARKIRLHGHVLVWHRELPRWMEKFKGSPAEWESMLKTHVQTVVGHCRSYINSWDVVNEAFNDDGTFRENVWLKNIGPSYLEKAFRYAHEASPEALLFYNDYSLEQDGPKLEAVLSHLSELRSRGVKIDGIGMQMHVTIDSPPAAKIGSATQKIAQRDFLVHYSELDISLVGHSLFESKKKLDPEQRQRMKEIVEEYMKLPPGQRFGITVWGVGDGDSWLNDQSLRSRPLLFDKRYRVKQAFCGFVDGLGGKGG